MSVISMTILYVCSLQVAKSPAVEIDFSIPKRATVKEEIEYTLIVDAETSDSVRKIGFHVSKIGEYSVELKKMINLKTDDVVKYDIDQICNTSDILYFHDKSFNTYKPTKKGYEFKTTFDKVGIFQIVSYFKYKNDTKIESNPVIIIVSPKLNKQGNIECHDWLHIKPKI